jgi:hypothetical protein
LRYLLLIGGSVVSEPVTVRVVREPDHLAIVEQPPVPALRRREQSDPARDRLGHVADLLAGCDVPRVGPLLEELVGRRRLGLDPDPRHRQPCCRLGSHLIEPGGQLRDLVGCHEVSGLVPGQQFLLHRFDVARLDLEAERRDLERAQCLGELRRCDLH